MRKWFHKNKRKIAKALSLVVVIAGILVTIGWILNISLLKSISPAWISMKVDTAIGFILSGIILFFIVRAMEGEFDQAQVVIAVTSFAIILLMGILLFSSFLGVQVGVEDLFIKEAAGTPKTVIPGRPSFPTMVNFILVALAGIFAMLNPRKTPLKLKVIGSMVGMIGLSAVIGYILNAPLLYYYLPDINSAMALHTALLFVLIGMGLLCLSD